MNYIDSIPNLAFPITFLVAVWAAHSAWGFFSCVTEVIAQTVHPATGSDGSRLSRRPLAVRGAIFLASSSLSAFFLLNLATAKIFEGIVNILNH